MARHPASAGTSDTMRSAMARSYAPRPLARVPSVARGGAGYSRRVILENGVVRTMDPSLPVARALAIAGDRVAGGVGTHETALPSPEVVNLRGRCVVPGFTDSHVHF